MQGALVDGKGEMWHSLAHHTIMFSLLADKLDNTFRRLRGLGKISEKNIADALRDIRLALLEADVEFGVAREFIGRVKERAMGQEVLKSIKPGEQIVKIFRDEIAALLGGDAVGLDLTDPARIMVVGLNGAGKTTTSAKLALRLKNEGRRPLLVACDLVRPAAVDQLATLAEQIGVPVYKPAPGSRDVVAVAREALEWARTQNGTVMIFDTAGRQEVDEALIDELRHLHSFLAPRETLLGADAATGQQAVNVAQTFDRAVNVTGIVLTKLDGDARGGAALSMRSVTGKPIKFIGVGEKLTDLEPFYPARMASRILGMGDVLSLIEKAQEAVTEEQAKRLEKKMREASFTLEDYLEQFDSLKKMGGIASVMGMMPGMGKLKIKESDFDEKKIERIKAIILSMTPKEREKPEIINSSRKKRIAAGSGTNVQEINQLLKQFEQTKVMMKQLRGGKKLPFMR